MFIYNEKVLVNRPFKLNELLKLVKANKDIKTDASVIAGINLSHVLSPATTNLEISKNVKEIYIITIDLKEKQIPNAFLDLFDKQIMFQTLFKLCYNNSVVYRASLKEFNEDETMKILKTFQTDWQDELKQEFPTTSKLENVYKTIISNITSHQFKQDEEFSDYVLRLDKIRKQKAEIDKLTRMMLAEKQPNIKMELNDKIKKLKNELKELEV